MALPQNYPVSVRTIESYTPSVGDSPVAAVFRIPFRCKILKVASVLNGAITMANASVAFAANGGAAFTTLSIPFTGSAAGQVNSATPSSLTTLNEDDYVIATPSLANGANIPAVFQLIVQLN